MYTNTEQVGFTTVEKLVNNILVSLWKSFPPKQIPLLPFHPAIRRDEYRFSVIHLPARCSTTWGETGELSTWAPSLMTMAARLCTPPVTKNHPTPLRCCRCASCSSQMRFSYFLFRSPVLTFISPFHPPLYAPVLLLIAAQFSYNLYSIRLGAVKIPFNRCTECATRESYRVLPPGYTHENNFYPDPN